MSAPAATVSLQNGTVAAANLANGAVAYVDPGNTLTVALQSSTGVQSWVLTVFSDYGPLNGWTYQSSQLFSATPIGLPSTPCRLTMVSEVTDGNNVFTSTNIIYNYARVTTPDRAVRAVVAGNTNLGNGLNVLVTQDGVTLVAGDRVLLAGQATLAQNGPYVLGAAVSNVCSLARPSDYAPAQVVVGTPVFEVAEGTLYNGSTWKGVVEGANGFPVVDTTNLTFYPKNLKFTLTNIANSATATANSFILTGAIAICSSTSTTNACKTTTVNAGQGNGNVTFACGSANDAGVAIVINW